MPYGSGTYGTKRGRPPKKKAKPAKTSRGKKLKKKSVSPSLLKGLIGVERLSKSDPNTNDLIKESDAAIKSAREQIAKNRTAMKKADAAMKSAREQIAKNRALIKGQQPRKKSKPKKK